MAQYDEVRIVAELRKQGEHERAEEVRLKTMRRTPPSHPRAPGALGWHHLGFPTPAGRRPVRGRTPTQAMTIDTERLRELAAELGFWPATNEEADTERHRQLNKNADYWLGRGHRFDHLRREARASETASESGSRLTTRSCAPC